MKKPELRDYQKIGLNEIVSHFENGVNGVFYTLPTGGGKTVVFSAFINHYLANGSKFVIIAHRQELLNQAHKTLLRLTGIDAGIIQAGNSTRPNSPIQLCMIQSLRSRELPYCPDYIITDEAHLCKAKSYLAFYEKHKSSKFLFVSATPCRSDGSNFRDIAQEIVKGQSIGEMIKEGYLSPSKVFTASNIAERLEKIKIDKGDYATGQLAKMMQSVELMGDIVRQYQKHASGRKGVVFCVNIEHSKAVAEAFNLAGIKAEHIDGESKDEERSSALDRLRTGETTIVSNCGILCEGWDEPSISYVGLARPTKSLALYIQQAGRGLRLFEGKENCIILDHANNTQEHGHIEEEREWTLDGIDPVQYAKTKGSNASHKKCPVCNEWVSMNKTKCKCGHQFKSDVEITVIETEMEEYVKPEKIQLNNEEKQAIRTHYINALLWCSREEKPSGRAYYMVSNKWGKQQFNQAIDWKESKELIGIYYDNKEI